MKILLVYDNNYYFNDKISNFIRNNELIVVYIGDYPTKILEKLYDCNNLILSVCSIENLKIKDGDYSLSTYGIYINNGKIIRIEEDSASYNPLHKNIPNITLKNSHINFKILYHNLLFYHKYFLLISVILLIVSYKLFGASYSVNMEERLNMIKQLK